MSSQETFYFGAGPATLPREVLKSIKNGLLDFNGTGLSILELSHRSKAFTEILNEAESLLRKLMLIPDDFEVLFLHGGATAQYSMIPLNLLGKNDKADYINSGHWSAKASEEAKRYAVINEVQVLEKNEQISIRPQQQWRLDDEAIYLHYCDNETISGVAFNEDLIIDNKRIVCDMTSSVLTREIDFSNYDLVYASTQKNLGIAGLCVVIVNKALIEEKNFCMPSVFNYKLSADEKSLVNTPPTFAIYVMWLMLLWLKSQTNVDELSSQRKKYAKIIYRLIDNSDIYKNKIAENNRSLINIPFEFDNLELCKQFLQQAEMYNLLGLRGHKSVGNARISLYNAMPLDGIEKLVEFMHEFESNYAVREH